eukprot:scpid92859/ scgid20614/ 
MAFHQAGGGVLACMQSHTTLIHTGGGTRMHWRTHMAASVMCCVVRVCEACVCGTNGWAFDNVLRSGFWVPALYIVSLSLSLPAMVWVSAKHVWHCAITLCPGIVTAI